MRLRHVFVRHRISLERGEIQRATLARLHPRIPDHQQIQARAEPQFAYAKPVTKPARQIITLQKYMAGFSDTVIKAEIGIIEFGRHRNAAFFPFNISCLVLHRAALYYQDF